MSDDNSVRGSSQPPVYPFPDDEVLYTSARSPENFTVGEDSYFVVARLPETAEHIFNGRRHENTHRFVIHTPEKGSQAMLTNHADFGSLLALALVGFLDSQQEAYTDDVDPQLSLTWLSHLIGESPEDVFSEGIES